MSFIAIIFYIFCTFMRPQEWIPVLHNKPLIDWLSASALLFLLAERMTRKENPFSKVSQNTLMIGLFFAIIMSHVAHGYLGGIIKGFNGFLPNFVIFFLLLNGINTSSKFRITIWLSVILIVLLVPQGMSQLETGYGWAGQPLTIHRAHSLTPQFRINWIGIFNDPNDLALIFVIAIGLGVAYLFGRTTYFGKVACVPLLSALLYGLYLTNSRGGMLALMVSVFFYFVKRTRKFIFGAIIGGLCAFLIFSFGPSRKALITMQDASAFNRIELWYQGFSMLKSNPLFGIGYERFMDDLAQTAHNSYILTAAELGLFGLFFFVGLFYVSFRQLSIIQEHDSELRVYAHGLQSALVGFAAAAFFLSRTYTIVPYMLFAFSGSLMSIAQKKNEEVAFLFKRQDIRNIFFLSLGVLLLTYIVIKVGL